MAKKRILILSAIAGILLILTLFFGSIPPSPLYYLKITRETLQTFFIFGDEDKANWLLVRTEKRITEAEKLKSKNLDFLANIQIQTARNYQSESKVLLDYLKDKTNINYLTDRYNQNEDRLKALSN